MVPSRPFYTILAKINCFRREKSSQVIELLEHSKSWQSATLAGLDCTHLVFKDTIAMISRFNFR